MSRIQPHPLSGHAFAGLRVGLLGGSFNPAHEGHRAISLYALKRLKLDQVWWLVSPQNPLKPSKGMAPLAARRRQAEQEASHNRILVTAIEACLGTHYTVDTLQALRKRFPRTQFVWLMGADNMRQIDQWRRWPQIFQHVPVAVFRRPAYAVGRKLGKAAVRFDRAWHPVKRGRSLASQTQPAWLILDNSLNKLSATAIRAQQKRG